MRLVYLEWEDAATRPGWIKPEDVDEFANSEFIVRQVGFVLKDTERGLVVAASWTPETPWKGEQFGDVTRIPRTWIRKRIPLGSTDGDTLHLRKR